MAGELSVLKEVKSVAICRPILPNQLHKVYEDESRSNQVLNEMHRFYQGEKWVDVVLCVESCKFPTHRLVLAASSMYFERMFTNGMCEEKKTEITLNQVTACAIKKLLEFSYTSKLDINNASVLEVFEAADMLQFSSARAFSESFLLDQIEKSNCLCFMVYADAFSSEPLYEKSKLISAKYFKHLCQTTEFLDLPVSHMVNLLRDDNIEMEYEEHVYMAMKQWIMHDESRKQFIPELFKCIRLNYVSRWYLIEVISKEEMLKSSDSAQNYIHTAKDQLLAQGHTYEIPWQLPPSRKCTGLTRKIVYINTYDPVPSESEVFLFDVVNKSWSNTSKPCPLASEVSTCENIEDAVLVVGGWNNPGPGRSLNEQGAVNIIHEFKVMPIFPTLWYVGAHNMGISRYLHSTVTVGNEIYLLGGYDETHCIQASMFVTDATKNYRFDVCPRMLYPVSKPAVASSEDRIYVFGGFGEGGVPRQFIQCYDINTRQWTEIRPGIHGVFLSCQFAVYINGLFYVVCGEVGRPQGVMNNMVGHLVPENIIDSIYMFNPHNRQWTPAYHLSEPRTGAVAITVLDGRIYLTGGLKNGVPYRCVDCYDPRTNAYEIVGNTSQGCLSLCTTMKVMHENFGL